MRIVEFQPYGDHTRQVWRWWSGTTFELGRPPRHNEIDPGAFIRALHKLWLVEWLARNDSFRYRLAGEEINRTHGFSLRGKGLAEVIPNNETRPQIEGAWRRVLAEPAVSYQTGYIYLNGQTVRKGERLVLPILANESDTPTFLLGITSLAKARELELMEAESPEPDYTHDFFPLKELLVKKA